MVALFARLWLSRSVTDPVGLTVAKPSPCRLCVRYLPRSRCCGPYRSRVMGPSHEDVKELGFRRGQLRGFAHLHRWFCQASQPVAALTCRRSHNVQ